MWQSHKISELITNIYPYLWSSLQEKGGIGFDDYGGELELYDWNITTNNDATTLPEPTLLGSIKTATRFGSLAWGKGDDISTSTDLFFWENRSSSTLVGTSFPKVLNVW